MQLAFEILHIGKVTTSTTKNILHCMKVALTVGARVLYKSVWAPHFAPCFAQKLNVWYNNGKYVLFSGNLTL